MRGWFSLGDRLNERVPIAVRRWSFGLSAEYMSRGISDDSGCC